MDDRFESNSTGLTSPSIHGFSVTPSDSSDLPELARAIYVGRGGSLTLTFPSGAIVTFENLPDGSLLPVRAARVMATNTTAEALVGLV